MASEWPTSIEDVIRTFQYEKISENSTNMQIWIMLEVLNAIPDGVSSKSTHTHTHSVRCQESASFSCASM